MEDAFIHSLSSQGPAVIVSCAFLYFFWRISDKLGGFLASHTESQILLAKRLQELSDMTKQQSQMIKELKEVIAELQNIIRKMYEELFKKQKIIEKYENGDSGR